LSIDRAPRSLELVFQFVVLAPQALPFRLRAAEVFAQALDLARLVVDDLLGIAGRRLGATDHATVMPNPRSKYKYEVLDSGA
jgi:hypothetical protein